MSRRARLFLAVFALSAGAPLARDAWAEGVEKNVHWSVRDVLEDDRYRFCHEDDYPLTPEEHAWCPIISGSSDVCPKLPAACKLPAVELSRSIASRRGGRGGRDASGKHPASDAPADRGPSEDERRRPAPEMRVDLSGMSVVASVLLIGLLVVFFGGVIHALVKNLLRDRAPAQEAAEEKAPARGPTPEETAKREIETDVQRLLARARSHAARGDYARAIDDAYAALLRRLDGDGLIEIHPSRTNGDYVRSLRERPDLNGAMRSIVRDVEGVQFGVTPPSEPLFRAVMDRVVPLVSRALSLALAVFGLSAALSFISVISCTPHAGGGDEGGGDRSPSGTQAVLEVLGTQGVKARRRGEALKAPDRALALVVLPGATIDDATWKDLFAWVSDKGGTLFLAGLPRVPDEVGLGLRVAEDAETSTALAADWSRGLRASLPPGKRLVDVNGDEPDDLFMILRGESSSTAGVVRRLGQGKVVVVADDRLVSNVSLAAPDNAQLFLDLLRFSPPAAEVEIVDEWTGVGAETPFAAVREARLWPVIAQLFLLLALLYLWKGSAFARLRDPPPAGRRAFADHARALGLAYRRARASRHAAGLYASWALDRLRERVHRSGRRGLIPLAEAIAARTGRPESEVMRALVEASGARDEAAPASSLRAPPSARGARPSPRSRDGAAADLELVRELQGFLNATGQRTSDRKTT
ncbi:DUF4350 domain-containing protein [Sorangium sp. So ce726]|uniref:DUF4350 domain-containing protein n=1 Tax=Sorangium sp. So ce726 TaxID=3133319 RepID=UPI003F6331E1